MQRALRYLSYCARSEREVERYLRQQGVAPAVGQAVIEKLRSFNYLNDISFAQSWARGRAQNRGYGPRRIELELTNKGIHPSVIRETLADIFNQKSERDNAQKLLHKRFRDASFDEPKTLRRAVALLQRSGYSNKVIFELLKLRSDEN